MICIYCSTCMDVYLNFILFLCVTLCKLNKMFLMWRFCGYLFALTDYRHLGESKTARAFRNVNPSLSHKHSLKCHWNIKYICFIYIFNRNWNPVHIDVLCRWEEIVWGSSFIKKIEIFQASTPETFFILLIPLRTGWCSLWDKGGFATFMIVCFYIDLHDYNNPNPSS